MPLCPAALICRNAWLVPPAAHGSPLINTVAVELKDPAAVVLQPRNVQALRTLFNIAHRLADSLGASWGYVVDVLHGLDRVLAAHSGPATGGGSQVGSS